MPHILLVDDDPSMRALVASALERPERTIDVAAHGEAALERMAERKPDLIVTDVVMPRMNGWTFVRRLRSNPSTAFIPVIFMTALTTPADRMRGFRTGADDYIMKPIDVCELELRVENVLYRARGARAGAALGGNLSQFGLATPLAILELERKTGLLTVARPPEHALFVVKHGRIVRAELTDHPGWSVIDCLTEVLAWSTGQFSFAEQAVNTSADAIPTTALLLEASQKLDELIPVEP
ncbi:MAG TPA: response regulator [Polyangiaceae bacterium]|jgi:DNA-binding response OmpR family regulator